MAILHFSSRRFVPTMDYTYPELRRSRPQVRERIELLAPGHGPRGPRSPERSTGLPASGDAAPPVTSLLV